MQGCGCPGRIVELCRGVCRASERGVRRGGPGSVEVPGLAGLTADAGAVQVAGGADRTVAVAVVMTASHRPNPSHRGETGVRVAVRRRGGRWHRMRVSADVPYAVGVPAPGVDGARRRDRARADRYRAKPAILFSARPLGGPYGPSDVRRARRLDRPRLRAIAWHDLRRLHVATRPARMAPTAGATRCAFEVGVIVGRAAMLGRAHTPSSGAVSP